MDDILEAALDYASKGYFVYPVNLSINEQGKKDVRFPGNWRDSTTNPLLVRELFVSGTTGIAIDTGKSGIVVLDIDVSAGKSGLSNLRDAGIDLPHTPARVSTWSGGYHGYFRQPADPVSSGANKPVRDVDFRGLGGVVFAPPTVVSGGERGEQFLDEGGIRTYSGVLSAVEELPILPEGYAQRLRSGPVERKPGVSTVPVPFNVREDQAHILRRYISEDIEEIQRAGDGERNETLGRTTIRVADRCIKLGYPYDDYVDLVVDAYQASGGTDQQQATDWCESAWKKALASPLAMPRTYIDEMADQRHAQIIANRLANARVTGATSQLVTDQSFVDWTRPPTPAPFWVAGVIPQGEQVVLYGKPESGKTFLAIDWGMSVATGASTWGRRTTQGNVWFMAGEGNARITTRMHAWMEHTGIRPDPQVFRLLSHVPDLMNEQVIETMARKVAEDEVDLVIIDTLGRAMAIGGGNVSEVGDAAVALLNLQRISKYRPMCTPVAIHHPVKTGDMAGGYNLLAGLDVALHAEVDEDQVGTLRFAKNKDGEKTTICEYEWRPVGQSAVLVPAYGGI